MPVLPEPEWNVFVDSETGLRFIKNHVTGEIQWFSVSSTPEEGASSEKEEASDEEGEEKEEAVDAKEEKVGISDEGVKPSDDHHKSNLFQHLD
jgi:hypothetical protein